MIGIEVNVPDIISKIEIAKTDILNNKFDAGTIASILNIAVGEDLVIFETDSHYKDSYVVGGGYSSGSEDVFIFLSNRIEDLSENGDNWSIFKRELRKTLKDELVCNEQNPTHRHKYVGVFSMNKGMLKDKPFMKSFASEIACDIRDNELILEKIDKGDSVMLDTYLENFDKDSSVVKKLLTYVHVCMKLKEES